jgi:GntR family transcriptional regulator, transcriptional repressor for pyruvate dehydrogenase complex
MTAPLQRKPRRPRGQKMALLIAQEIVSEITTRGLSPGSMLPPERDMLATYEVGRGTLRESLRFLEMQGVISIKPGPGGGPVVNNPDSRDLAQTLSLFLQLLDTRFSSIVEARMVLEPAMAASAAVRIDPDHLDEIRTSVERMEAHTGDDAYFLEENERFHELVAWSSGNSLFGLLITSLHWITDGTALGVDYPEPRQHAVIAAHRSIYEAIASREPDKARAAMERHISEFAKYIERSYPGVWESSLRWDQLSASRLL